MSIAGNIYGVVLNDRDERAQLAGEFEEKPYAASPRAPVVYMKPLSSLVRGPIPLPAEGGLVASTTLAVLFARDAARLAPQDVSPCIGAMAVALDLALPAASYYRPAVAQKNGDGRLAIGGFAAPCRPSAIRLLANESSLHEWSLDRAVRPLETLVADLSAFMTLKAGDVLLIGLPGDAPMIHAAGSLRVEAGGLPSLSLAISGGAA